VWRTGECCGACRQWRRSVCILSGGVIPRVITVCRQSRKE
jgi:hypothetical protein